MCENGRPGELKGIASARQHLFDMQGNAFEWVYDAFMAYPANSKDAAADDVPQTNAVLDTGRRVLRGGSFYSLASKVRSALRDSASLPGYRLSYVGFRPSRTYYISLNPNG